MQEKLFTERCINWNDFDPKLKRGRMIVKEQYEKVVDIWNGEDITTRNRWVSEAPPTFTQNRCYIENLIHGKRDDFQFDE